MPRICTVCSHHQRALIDQALLAEDSFRNIAERFGTSVGALVRHKTDHLPAHLVQSKEAKEVAQADNLIAELKRITARVNLLFDACDRWLRDPDNPDQYDVGPRANEIKVTYEESIDDTVVRRKANLSDLLKKVEGLGVTAVLVETKHADPRHLLLNASGRLANQLELLAKLLGELQENRTVNILVSPEWIKVRSVIVETLWPYPEARFAVAEALGKLH